MTSRLAMRVSRSVTVSFGPIIFLGRMAGSLASCCSVAGPDDGSAAGAADLPAAGAVGAGASTLRWTATLWGWSCSMSACRHRTHSAHHEREPGAYIEPRDWTNWRLQQINRLACARNTYHPTRGRHMTRYVHSATVGTPALQHYV